MLFQQSKSLEMTPPPQPPKTNAAGNVRLSQSCHINKNQQESL